MYRAPTMRLTDLEQRVVDRIAQRESELVELLRALIGFDTVTHRLGASPREEAALQAFVAERLRRAGAQVEVSEPDVLRIADHPAVPAGFSFAGRPQLVARFDGAGGGRTLLLCGHVDVVDADAAQWTVDPFDAVVDAGAVWGRGACDMKGGVASMIVAAETLAELDVVLAGDLLVNTVTDEESTGAGGLVSARSLRADGAIVPEPSSLAVATACRGSMLPSLIVRGRAGHAGVPPRHHLDGGAVNAIDKAALMIEAMHRLREEWALRRPHPLLSPADCVPTQIAGGEWIVSYPEQCILDCHIEYLPTGDGGDPAPAVQREFEEWIAAAAAADPWLREHPPEITWSVGSVPPAQVDHDDRLVRALVGADRDLGGPGAIAGFDNWHDGAFLIVEGQIPAVCYGPRALDVAHTVDERVPIEDLVRTAQGIALTAMRFCGPNQSPAGAASDPAELAA